MFFKKIFIQCLIIVTLTSAILTNTFAGGGEGDIAAIEGVLPINISQAEELLKKDNVYLFDANTYEIRRDVGVIPDATLVETSNFEAFLPTDKSAILIYYCLNRMCTVSSQMALKAQERGFKNVYVMIGGIEGWGLSGRPIEKLNEINWLRSSIANTYEDSIHNGIMFGVLPSCRDCHGNTDTGKIDISSANEKTLINNNCMSCHKDVKEEFSQSIHTEYSRVNLEGKELFDNGDKPNDKGKLRPTCWDCHSVHNPEIYIQYTRMEINSNKYLAEPTKKFTDLNLKQISETTCAKCHQEKTDLSRETFHGKALYLTTKDDMPTVTSCYDCHGKHNIQKVDDPKSTLYTGTRVKTCGKCHDNSHESFASYIGHPDATNKEKYPILYYVSVCFIILIISVFTLFGIHTLLWWIRMFFMKVANPIAWKKARDAAHHDKVAIRRFTPLNRLQHFFMAVSFLTLSLTGLPQMFYDTSWAQKITTLLGGPIMLTKIHHIAAIVLILVFIVHIIEVSIVAWKGKDSIRNPDTGKLELKRFWKVLCGPESLFPRLQDFKDLVSHMKWFLFMGPRPQFDRWTYWEKFEYLAEIWGTFVFGITGAILWFPTIFTTFMPGWVVNLSTIIHSYEAILAMGFIFAIHFFNTHFRIDRFPMDMVIFSGTITQEEMLQERKLWYNRLEKNGRLAKLVKQSSKSEKYTFIYRVTGFIMLAFGFLFLGFMIYALF